MQVNNLPELILNLKKAVKEDEFWSSEIANCMDSVNSIHLAIFVEPFLQWIVEGKKIIESRFSVNKCAPYRKIMKGDIIVLKKSGGPVVAIAKAGTIWFYNLDTESLKEIKDKFSAPIGAHDPQFWESRKSASYATLIKLDRVLSVSNFNFPKRDRRGWVILKPHSQLKLDL